MYTYPRGARLINYNSRVSSHEISRDYTNDVDRAKSVYVIVVGDRWYSGHWTARMTSHVPGFTPMMIFVYNSTQFSITEDRVRVLWLGLVTVLRLVEDREFFL